MAGFWSGVLVIWITFSLAQSCPNGARRRRSVETDTATFNDRLAKFFGACRPLREAADGVFESLQSAVDYTLRGTNWFQDVRNDICVGRRDVAECWIFALDFLLLPNSVFFKPAAQCICDWAEDCFDPRSSHQGHSRPTRSSNLYTIHPPPPPVCKPAFKSRPLTPEQLKFTACFERKILTFKDRYPSLKRLEGSSISLFLRDHFTFCRTVPVKFPYNQRNLFQLLFIDKVCPRTGRSSDWRRNFIQVFRDATRRNSPLGRTIDLCDPDAMPVYGPWSRWSRCTKTCGEEIQTRTRKCMRPPCNLPTKESRSCHNKPCPHGPCEPNPCLYGGKCIPTTNSYGEIYQFSYSQSSPQGDSSYRPPSSGGFECHCPHKYSGDRCQHEPPICKDDHDFCNTYGDWACNGLLGDGCKKSCNKC